MIWCYKLVSKLTMSLFFKRFSFLKNFSFFRLLIDCQWHTKQRPMGHITHLRNSSYQKTYLCMIWLNHNIDYGKKTIISFFHHWIGLVVWDKKIFKVCPWIFYISLLSSLLKKVWPFIWTHLNPFHPRMFFAKFGWNLPSGSGEENENVKILQTNGQTDGQRTTGDQKSPLELSAQVN